MTPTFNVDEGGFVGKDHWKRGGSKIYKWSRSDFTLLRIENKMPIGTFSRTVLFADRRLNNSSSVRRDLNEGITKKRLLERFCSPENGIMVKVLYYRYINVFHQWRPLAAWNVGNLKNIDTLRTLRICQIYQSNFWKVKQIFWWWRYDSPVTSEEGGLLLPFLEITNNIKLSERKSFR